MNLPVTWKDLLKRQEKCLSTYPHDSPRTEEIKKSIIRTKEKIKSGEIEIRINIAIMDQERRRKKK
jgi:hypothetical protein